MQHHEVGTAGQAEIDIRGPASSTRFASAPHPHEFELYFDA